MKLDNNTYFTYDDLGHQLSGTSNDYSASFTYSPASQITTRTSINDGIYRWTGSNGGNWGQYTG